MKFPEQLPKDEQDRLLLLAQNGDRQARETLVTTNLRLVTRVSQKYRKHTDIDTDDLFQVGVEALIRAVDSFNQDPQLFVSYASKKITHAIGEHLSTSALSASVGRFSTQTYIRHYNAVRALTRDGIPEAEACRQVADSMGTSLHKVWEAVQIMSPSVSIEEDLDFLDDTDPSSVVEDMLLSESFAVLFNALPVMERLVLEYRVGLNDVPVKALGAISKDLGVSHKEVVRLEASGFARLRHPSYAAKLAS